MTHDDKLIQPKLDSIKTFTDDIIGTAKAAKGLSKANREAIVNSAANVRYHAYDASRALAELLGTLPVKLVVVDKTVERLNSKADSYDAYVAKYEGSLHSIIEAEVNRLVSRDLRDLAQALKVSEGEPSNQPYATVEDPDRPGRTYQSRKLSPEEQVEWRVENAQDTVFRFVNGLNSRSTSESSRIEEQVRAQAASEMLDFLGGSPKKSAYGHNLIVWEEEES